MRPALLVVLALSTLATPPAFATPMRKERLAKPTECGDLLARVGHKPAHLVYEGCRYLPDNQGKPLAATYRVAGRHAASVARSLRRTIGMNPVKKYCCQWEALRSEFSDARGQQYSILMVSGETVHLTRDAWPKIERFEVQIETYTEEI